MGHAEFEIMSIQIHRLCWSLIGNVHGPVCNMGNYSSGVIANIVIV